MSVPSVPKHCHASTMPYLSAFEMNKAYAEKFSQTYDQMRYTKIEDPSKQHGVIKVCAEVTEIVFCYYPTPDKRDAKADWKVSYTLDPDQFVAFCHVAKERLLEMQKTPIIEILLR